MSFLIAYNVLGMPRCDNLKINIMKKPDLIKQLANRINQPHVVESWINKIEKAAYNKGYKDAESKQCDIPVVSTRKLPPWVRPLIAILTMSLATLYIIYKVFYVC